MPGLVVFCSHQLGPVKSNKKLGPFCNSQNKKKNRVGVVDDVRKTWLFFLAKQHADNGKRRKIIKNTLD
jgi:hypothetical protein